MKKSDLDLESLYTGLGWALALMVILVFDRVTPLSFWVMEAFAILGLLGYLFPRHSHTVLYIIAPWRWVMLAWKVTLLPWNGFMWLLDKGYKHIETDAGGASLFAFQDPEKHNLWVLDLFLGTYIATVTAAVAFFTKNTLVIIGASVFWIASILAIATLCILIAPPYIKVSEKAKHRMAALLHYVGTFVTWLSPRLWWAKSFARRED
jgi:hypothetical protein